MGDEELRLMGKNPAKAIRRWGKLGDREKWVVADSMARHYDIKFTKHFVEEANKRTRPDESIDVVNDGLLTPDKLMSMGYRKKGDFGGTEVWVHPSGKELWLLPRPKALPPAPQSDPLARPQALPAESEDVQDARKKVDELEEKKTKLQERYNQLMARRDKGSAAWKRDATELLIDRWDFANEIASVQQNDIPDWKDGLGKADLEKMQQLEDRLNGCYIDPDDLKPLDDADPDSSLMKEALRRKGRTSLF